MRRSLVAAALLFAARALALDAQVVDTTRADSLRADTTDYTALFLRSQQEAKRLIPATPRIGASALYPLRTRIIFDRDSVIWYGAETVSDLLTRVPGVYLLRGGWAGRPELPSYQAHGASSVSYLLDGIPYLPLGQDSLLVDPSLFPLSFIDRVEIERLPGQLRVSLFTHRNDRSAPYSRIGIGSGDLRIARYQGQLEKRSARGPGFAVGFDHFAVPVQSGQTGAYENTQAMLRAEYIRNARAGAEAQLLLSSPDRDSVLAGGAGEVLSRARHGSRRDLSLRAFFAPGKNGLGPRVDLIASRSRWVDDIEKDSTLVVTDVKDSSGAVIGKDTSFSVDKHHRGITQLGAVAAYRLPEASLEGSFFWRSSWTPLDLRLGGAITPLRWLTVRLDGTYLNHEGGRSSRWLTARGGAALPWGFQASATWRKGNEVSLPVIRADSAQAVDDRSVSLAWRKSFAELEATFTTNAGFQPAGYAQYPALVSIAPSGRTDWLTVSGRIAPRQWLILSGWYNTPRAGLPQGQPPNHALIYATIQSKFLPTFKSGIFNLKLQASMERWGAGVLGRDSTGAQVAVEAATYFRGYLGLQIGSFTAYYDRYNMQGTLKAYVPGLPIPTYASTFGVRWEFAN
ncbi:MAG TPA: Plug domain-containing protein [Gemmatimonadales bacterium]|nr:Plug domain-containing protein [Gemmatimonadales bacterium]